MAKKEKLSHEELLQQAIVKDEDKPYRVPPNWIWTKWGYVGDFIAGNGFKPDFQGFTEYKIPFYKVGSLKYSTQGGYLFDRANTINEEILAGLKATLIPINSVIFAKIGEAIRLNRRCLNVEECCIDNNLMAFVSKKTLNYKYVYYWSYTQDFYEIANATTVPAIRKSDLENISFPLPPLSEQQRIVNLIESLFEKIDRAKELAQSALDSFEKSKSAILHKAFTGELTAKWREKNDVENINNIIIELFEHRLSLSTTTVEKSKIENIFSYLEYSSGDKLPDGWKYVTLEKLCESFQYGTSNKSDNEGKVVVLRMGNLQSGRIDWSNLAYSSDENDIEKYILKKGDVLFNRTNSPELVGKTSIYEGEQPAIFAGYLIRIKNYGHLDSHYLNYAMNTSYARAFCISVKSDGVNQSNINAQKLAKFEIPFCSLAEQKEIVRILDSLFEKEQKAKELCDVIEKIDLIKKAILARAFRGALGTNNPEEESALELLKEVLRSKL